MHPLSAAGSKGNVRIRDVVLQPLPGVLRNRLQSLFRPSLAVTSPPPKAPLPGTSISSEATQDMCLADDGSSCQTFVRVDIMPDEQADMVGLTWLCCGC